MGKMYIVGLFLTLVMFSGCGKEDIDQSLDVVKSPQNTTKYIKALAEDEQDWTWFVGTDGSRSGDSVAFDVYFMKNIPQEVQHFQYFLDVDNDANTGFSFGRDSWRISGADYLVEDGELYKSTSKTEWSWEHIGNFETYNRRVEGGVAHIEISTHKQDIIALFTASTVNITIEPFDENWGSTYSTISTDHVKLNIQEPVLEDTMVLSANRVDAAIDIHDNTPAGAYISYEDDNFVHNGEKVVELHGAGMQNSFHFIGYETDIKYNWWSLPSHQYRNYVSWDGKFDDDFVVFIVLKFKTADGKILRNDLVYGPSQYGYVGYTDGFMYIPLGQGAEDGQWHHYKRNILDDLHRFYPGATIDFDDNYSGYLNGFAIRGAGRVTNIKLSAH